MQAPRTGLPQDRLICDRLEGVRGELEVDVVELEKPTVLLHEGVARLSQDANESTPIQAAHAGDHRQAAHELGDHAVLQQVLRHNLAEDVSGIQIML